MSFILTLIKKFISNIYFFLHKFYLFLTIRFFSLYNNMQKIISTIFTATDIILFFICRVLFLLLVGIFFAFLVVGFMGWIVPATIHIKEHYIFLAITSIYFFFLGIFYYYIIYEYLNCSKYEIYIIIFCWFTYIFFFYFLYYYFFFKVIKILFLTKSICYNVFLIYFIKKYFIIYKKKYNYKDDQLLDRVSYFFLSICFFWGLIVSIGVIGSLIFIYIVLIHFDIDMFYYLFFNTSLVYFLIFIVVFEVKAKQVIIFHLLLLFVFFIIFILFFILQVNFTILLYYIFVLIKLI